jgi:glutamine amidotransferase
MKSCLILDYGVGNIGSIESFLKEHHYRVVYGNSISQITESDLLVLPGVGSFKEASRNLHSLKLIDPIRERHFASKPILGICLGLQLLTEGSAESPNSSGLGIFPGITERLSEFSNIGWDSIQIAQSNPLSKEYFYFNHSYAAHHIRGSRFNVDSTNGGFTALVVENRTVGVQFHPEKSQKAGSIFLSWVEDSIWASDD